MRPTETSIVVRTFNEERYLPGLLGAIERQRYRDYEIINVDSGSYDRTTDISRDHGARILRINSQDFTFGYSLNVGIKSATGRFIVIVSAHTEPIDDLWLEKLVAPLHEEDVAMVYGRQLGVDSSKYGEVRDLARTFGTKRKVLRPPLFFANNANSAIQRELWLEHPFDPILPGQEDIEWAKYWMERGRKLVYEPEAGIYHIHHETWRQVRRRYYREAVATEAIGVWRRRDAISLALREVAYLASDSTHALMNGDLLSRGSEIMNFRYNKAYGAISGLLSGGSMVSAGGRDNLFFDRKCVAVVVHGRHQASLEEIDVPIVKPGDVLVKTAYVGVSNVDLGTLSGDSSFQEMARVAYPVIPGHEISGWVARVGSNITQFMPSDPVVVQPERGCGICEACQDSRQSACQSAVGVGAGASTGAYAEYVSVPGRLVHKLPEGTDLRRAVLCEALAGVLKGLRKITGILPEIGDPSSVAVVGGGPIGHLCAQVLSTRGNAVSLFDRNPKRLEYFKDGLIHPSGEAGDLSQFRVIVEATGDPGALQHILGMSRSDALILVLGLPYSRRMFTVQDGIVIDQTIVWSAGADTVDFQRAIELLPELPMDSLMESIFPLEQFREAWQHFQRGEHLKVLIKVFQ